MSISYKENLSDIDYTQLNAMLVDIFGSKKAKDVLHTKTVFEKSQYFVFAFDDGQLIGAVRAISDGEWAVIYNFGVQKEYQGSAVEKEVLSRLVRQLKGQHIFTNALPGTLAFYEQNGFQRTKTAYTYVGFEQDIKNYPKGYFLPEGYCFENEFYKVKLPFASHHIPQKKKEVFLSYTTSREGIDYARVTEIIAQAFRGEYSESTDREKPFEETFTILEAEEVAKTKHLFDISDYVSFAYDDNRLVGVARAITDGLEEAYIQNVAVDPAYQGYGIGWQVVVNLSEDIKKDGLNPFLHTHPGAVGFYNRKGFLRNKTAFDYRGPDEGNEDVPQAVEQGFYMPIGYRFPDEIKA